MHGKAKEKKSKKGIKINCDMYWKFLLPSNADECERSESNGKAWKKNRTYACINNIPRHVSNGLSFDFGNVSRLHARRSSVCVCAVVPSYATWCVKPSYHCHRFDFLRFSQKCHKFNYYYLSIRSNNYKSTTTSRKRRYIYISVVSFSFLAISTRRHFFTFRERASALNMVVISYTWVCVCLYAEIFTFIARIVLRSRSLIDHLWHARWAALMK